jgi:immunity protein 63 of polymorphic toxin system
MVEAEMQSLSEVKAEMMRLAGLIGAADDRYLPSFEGYKRHGDDEFCVEMNEAGYHYFYLERGQKSTLAVTSSSDELLYHIFKDVTSDLASRYEVAHRIRNQDSRRLRFQKQIELMSVLSPAWRDRLTGEFAKILGCHPYDDAVDARIILYKKLKAEGYTPEMANELSDKQYPRPTPTGKDCGELS